ncbi:MAG: PilZ domain-containing protein [Lachnospiraceae bacterium]|nr:PilZ domain-containing protein [Lachnospiraceae bacterium]MBP5184255.1 PilZ domain-containing protein [Lachnospiraceae bacterium]
MIEKRREKRLEASLSLQISSLFKQDNVLVNNIDAPIEVINISRGGIGFVSESELPLGFYFNANINLGDDDASLYCVVKIIRKETREDGKTIYGCELVGMAPVLSYIFENYEKSLEEKKK